MSAGVIIGGILAGCAFIAVAVINIYCVCKRIARERQRQTVLTATYGPYVLNQMTYGAQGQAPYCQKQYPAQLPFQTEQMIPGASVVSNPEMPDPPSYEKCVDK